MDIKTVADRHRILAKIKLFRKPMFIDHPSLSITIPSDNYNSPSNRPPRQPLPPPPNSADSSFRSKNSKLSAASANKFEPNDLVITPRSSSMKPSSSNSNSNLNQQQSSANSSSSNMYLNDERLSPLSSSPISPLTQLMQLGFLHNSDEKNDRGSKIGEKEHDIMDDRMIRAKNIRVNGINSQSHIIKVAELNQAKDIRDKIFSKFNITNESDKKLYAIFAPDHTSRGDGNMISIDDETLLKICKSHDDPLKSLLTLRKTFSFGDDKKKKSSPPTSRSYATSDGKLSRENSGLKKNNFMSKFFKASTTTVTPETGSPFSIPDVPKIPSSFLTTDRKINSMPVGVAYEELEPAVVRRGKLNKFFGERPPDDLIADKLEDFFPGIAQRHSQNDEVPSQEPTLASGPSSPASIISSLENVATSSALQRKNTRVTSPTRPFTEVPVLKSDIKTIVQAAMINKRLSKVNTVRKSSIVPKSPTKIPLRLASHIEKPLREEIANLDFIQPSSTQPQPSNILAPSVEDPEAADSQIEFGTPSTLRGSSTTSNLSTLQSNQNNSMVSGAGGVSGRSSSYIRNNIIDGGSDLRPPSPSLRQMSVKNSILDEDGSGEEKRKSLPPITRWEQGKLIGQGAFGKVFLGINLDTGDILAVKQVLVGNANDPQKQKRVDALKVELELLKEMDHEYIVRYLGFQITPETFNVFLEYVSGGSVASLLGKVGRFDETLAGSISLQLLIGLEYLHDRRIIHRDIKGANILIDGDGIAKISDFGISKKNDYESSYRRQTRMSMQGTPFWMAPEVTKGNGYSAKVDIWSIGCLVLEMLTGNQPWHNVKGNIIFKLGKGEKPPIPSDLSPIAIDFLEVCFTTDPEERPTATQLISHPFVQVDQSTFDFKDWYDQAMDAFEIARELERQARELETSSSSEYSEDESSEEDQSEQESERSADVDAEAVEVAGMEIAYNVDMDGQLETNKSTLTGVESQVDEM